MQTLILVSHSAKITEGIKELITEMVPDADNTFEVIAAGGTEDGEIGTSPMPIVDSIQNAKGDHVYIFTDMGSAVLSSETAIDFLTDEQKEKVTLLESPIVESAYIAAVQSTIGASHDDLLKAIEEQA